MISKKKEKRPAKKAKALLSLYNWRLFPFSNDQKRGRLFAKIAFARRVPIGELGFLQVDDIRRILIFVYKTLQGLFNARFAYTIHILIRFLFWCSVLFAIVTDCPDFAQYSFHKGGDRCLWGRVKEGLKRV
jgi:hypothetical protein